MHWLSKAERPRQLRPGAPDQAAERRRRPRPRRADRLGRGARQGPGRLAGQPAGAPGRRRASPRAPGRGSSTAGFMTWAVERAGAPAVVQWLAANDPAASLAAIKTGGTLGTLLDGVTDQPAIRPALKQLFVAATAADDRRRLYEIRFNTRAAGHDRLDGERRGPAGTSRSWRPAPAAIAPRSRPPSPPAARRTSAGAIAADAKSPLVELRDELDDTFVDEDLCLCADRAAHRSRGAAAHARRGADGADRRRVQRHRDVAGARADRAPDGAQGRARVDRAGERVGRRHRAGHSTG